ncbi:hypothetical protein [Gorillibacterium sp. CAU 1737]|uniref:hypothetical protein n=1 Tax=Gorillibacterium sp. CAU 1737 TaxID=3140362 RepID=UPI00326099C7
MVHNLFQSWREKKHPFRQLNMGLVKQYSMIVPKGGAAEWTATGWKEDHSFKEFRYEPKENEVLLLNRPVTLLDIEMESLVGRRIVNFSTQLGSYGTGGPSFFGLLLDRAEGYEYLVYTIWASEQHLTMDDRVVGCHIRYNADYHPWASRWAGESDENQWDDLSGVINGSTITGVHLSEEQFVIELESNENQHTMTFHRMSDLLSPQGNGQPRKPAFAEDQGPIGKYLMFCRENAVLHV